MAAATSPFLPISELDSAAPGTIGAQEFTSDAGTPVATGFYAEWHFGLAEIPMQALMVSAMEPNVLIRCALLVISNRAVTVTPRNYQPSFGPTRRTVTLMVSH